jgi:hypothetical protein
VCSSLRAGATPRVVYAWVCVRCESRAGQQHQAHGAAADGATLRTSRAAGEVERVRDQAKDHGAAWRPAEGGWSGWRVGGVTADTDTVPDGVKLLNSKRRQRAVLH